MIELERAQLKRFEQSRVCQRLQASSRTHDYDDDDDVVVVLRFEI